MSPKSPIVYSDWPRPSVLPPSALPVVATAAAMPSASATTAPANTNPRFVRIFPPFVVVARSVPTTLAKVGYEAVAAVFRAGKGGGRRVILEVFPVEAVTALRPEEGAALRAEPRGEREFNVAHEYDTLDRDLERMGMTLSRLPGEAGVTWRLSLPRGERVDAWEPGNEGLAPPVEIVDLVGGVLAGKEL